LEFNKGKYYARRNSGTRVEKILLTHAHADQIGALVYLHPADAEAFSVSYDIPLVEGNEVSVGNLSIKAIHTPGHTSGETCFDLGDGRVLVITLSWLRVTTISIEFLIDNEGIVDQFFCCVDNRQSSCFRLRLI